MQLNDENYLGEVATEFLDFFVTYRKTRIRPRKLHRNKAKGKREIMLMKTELQRRKKTNIFD